MKLEWEDDNITHVESTVGPMKLEWEDDNNAYWCAFEVVISNLKIILFSEMGLGAMHNFWLLCSMDSVKSNMSLTVVLVFHSSLGPTALFKKRLEFN